MIEVFEILELLEAHKNVLISGPPGTGKSMLLNDVATRFESDSQSTIPHYRPESNIPIQSSPATQLPLRIRTSKNRKVFRCVLHQSSKYREFLTGIVPDVRKKILQLVVSVS